MRWLISDTNADVVLGEINPALICSDLSCVSLLELFIYSLQRVDCVSGGFYLCVLYVKYIEHRVVYCGPVSSLSFFFHFRRKNNFTQITLVSHHCDMLVHILELSLLEKLP